jgi:hypothetical protein
MSEIISPNITRVESNLSLDPGEKLGDGIVISKVFQSSEKFGYYVCGSQSLSNCKLCEFSTKVIQVGASCPASLI